MSRRNGLVSLAAILAGLLSFLRAGAEDSSSNGADVTSMANRLIDQPAQPSSDRVYHVAMTGIPSNDIGSEPPARLTIPTQIGLLQFDIHSPGRRTGQGQAPAEPASSQERSTGETVAIAAMILAGLYLIGTSLLAWIRKSGGRKTVVTEGESWRDNYPITRVIGEGGMGIVYEAVDRSLDRKVAIKKMHDNLRNSFGEFEQFLKEAKVVASLHHPAIVSIHSIIHQGGEVYLVFEYVEGQTLERLLAARGTLSLEEVKNLLGPICHALDFAHARNVIHRDLKPSNVMVTEQGFVKVMDFGIARRVKELIPRSGSTGISYNMTQTVAGTPLYMAPETERGIVCPEVDVFSLGVMAYEMLSGRVPFPPPASARQKEAREYAPLASLVPGLPSEVERLVSDALEPDPGRRIHSPREFWARLSAISSIGALK